MTTHTSRHPCLRYPHNLSYSELEKLYYLLDPLTHNTIFKHTEPGPEKNSPGYNEKINFKSSPEKLEKDFINVSNTLEKVTKQIELLFEDNKKLTFELYNSQYANPF